MKYLGYLSILGVALSFIGCASASVEYKEIYIPTKCEIPYPTLADKTDDIIQDQKNLVIYTLELENALDCCIKGECE